MRSWLHLSFLDEVALSLVAPCSFCLCLFLNDIKKQLFQGFLFIKGAPATRLCLLILLYLVVSYFLWLHFVSWRGCIQSGDANMLKEWNCVQISAASCHTLQYTKMWGLYLRTLGMFRNTVGPWVLLAPSAPESCFVASRQADCSTASLAG